MSRSASSTAVLPLALFGARHPLMIQELFSIGPFSISPFGVLLALAFVAAYWQLGRGFRTLGIGDQEAASEVLIWAGVGGVLGAKLYYTILYQDWSLLFSRSGLVWYGGFILGSLGALVAFRRRSIPLDQGLDAASVALALGYAVGRVGCFLVGDDYGVPTDLPWGVEFANGLPPTTAGSLRAAFDVSIPASVPASELIAVHPTQLYETFIALAIWRLGVRALSRPHVAGSVAALVIGLLAVERFAIEFLRAKDDRFFGGFTLAQFISLAVLVVALWFWASLKRDRASEG